MPASCCTLMAMGSKSSYLLVNVGLVCFYHLLKSILGDCLKDELYPEGLTVNEFKSILELP